MWGIEMLRVALSAMAQNKLRAFLTMLGIIIGVFSVVAMMAFGEGMKRSILARLGSMAESDLTIYPGPVFNRGWGDRDILTMDDYTAIRDECPDVRSLVPSFQGSSTIQFRDKMESATILATTPGFGDVMHLVPRIGRVLAPSDAEYSRRVCVLGANVAAKLTAGPRIVGDVVRLPGWGSASFQVVGVLEPRGQTGFIPIDGCVIVPIQTSRNQYQGKIRVTVMFVRLVDNHRLIAAASDIARVLRRSKRLARGESNNFNITPTLSLVQITGRIQQILDAFLAGIGVISLGVGGIGVMNIMLASVSERTREIGIRKSLGATRFGILAQFATEAVVLCAAGGCVAILLAYGLARLIARGGGGGITLVITPHSVAIGLAVSATVGLIFGIGPAWRAARLDPVEALRHE